MEASSTRRTVRVLEHGTSTASHLDSQVQLRGPYMTDCDLHRKQDLSMLLSSSLTCETSQIAAMREWEG